MKIENERFRYQALCQMSRENIDTEDFPKFGKILAIFFITLVNVLDLEHMSVLFKHVKSPAT